MDPVHGAAADPAKFLDAVHLPNDAGVYAEGLLRILRRIPPGWGRWIGCGAGWYTIIVRLDADIAALLPEYEVHQVKEKYGTLRYYWGVPLREPSCCAAFMGADPRPAAGAITGPFAPADRHPHEQRLLEEWHARYTRHLDSDEHAHVAAAADAAVDLARGRALSEQIEALIDAAEAATACTCERCGAPGSLHEHTGWLATLCHTCAQHRGYTEWVAD